MVFTIHQHESATGTIWKCSDSQMFENLWLTIFPKISPFSHLKEERASSKGISGCVCVLSHFSRVWLFATLWTVAQQAPLSVGFSSKNTGVGCHALLQGIFPTQGLNLSLFCLLHWQAGSLPLVPPEKPNLSVEPTKAKFLEKINFVMYITHRRVDILKQCIRASNYSWQINPDYVALFISLMEKKNIFKANAFNLKVFIYLIIMPQNIWSKKWHNWREIWTV